MARTLTSGSANTVIDPRRAKIARLRRGLKKVELAREMGVTPRSITRYETDGVPEISLDAFCTATEFPRTFFYRDATGLESNSATLFRAGRRATQTQKDTAIACGLMGCELDTVLRTRFKLPGLRLPDLSGLSPSEAARELRSVWSIGPEAPLPNLVQLCESNGVHVYGLPPVAQAVDAFSNWYGTQPLVFLSRQKSPERSRFDVAHELGHLVLHNHSSCDQASDQEKEADAFASEFLLPEAVIRRTMRNTPSISMILTYRDSFKLSAMAVAMAAKHAGKFSDHAFKLTMRNLSAKGYRRGEPGGMVAQEKSRIFGEVFRKDNPKHITIAELSGELGFPIEDIHSLTFGTQIVGLTGGRRSASPSEYSVARQSLRIVQK
ncbi:XRE family transcriptional regulator [Corynebacterium falsenii]|uniref:XRE family transcriptional regulator n=1 Tax=Corynebacterium falsenii TaxID=108486 RepID=UPI003FCF4C96